MKKLSILICFCILMLFVDCKQNVSLGSHIENEELNDIKKREFYLSTLMETGNYHVEEEKIKRDLLNILQELENDSETRSVLKSTPIIEKIEESFINTKDVIPFSITQEQNESIKLYIHKILDEKKEGFAITCNDLRIGEILAIIEEGEFKKDITNDPFMKLIVANIESHVKTTLQNWEKLKKEKDTSRSIFSDMVESNNYIYSNWNLVNGNLENILKTKWNQMDPYNKVINKMAFCWEWEEIEYDGGHAWVIDGYCKLACDAQNTKTGEKNRITLDYVHCNPGWGGISNGYYISDIFSFHLGANANDYQIKNNEKGYYKYEIKIFPELIPEKRLAFDWFFDWYPL